MLKITNAKGQILELNKNTAISVERNNSLFNSDSEFAHDLTYPGQAGLTDSNKIFIGSGHLVEANNSVYEFPVQVSINDYEFYVAIFSYKIVKEQIEYILKVNFGALASKMKSVQVREIYTLDPFPNIFTNAALVTYMKNTCLNPNDYPYVFFPLFNDSWNSGGHPSSWLNEWDHTNQVFKNPPTVPGTTVMNTVPWVRLSYVIRKIIEALGLEASGSYFSAPKENEIYLYHRRTILSYGVQPSQNYLPELSINDFLRYITDRRKLSFDFDLLNGKVNVDSADTILNSNECIDISDYIESIDEKSVAEQKGYRITLKVDESDDSMNIGTESDPIYTPKTELVVGSGQIPVELEVGTLNAISETAGYTYPMSKQVFDVGGVSEVKDWQLRLMRFRGMKVLPDMKVFPEALPVNLDSDDARWYQFLNDSKKVIITAKIPPGVVLKMRPTIKLACNTEKTSFFYVLPEKISYSMGNNITERMTVKIEARTIVADNKTKYYINALTAATALQPTSVRFKAYWLTEVHGFEQVQIKKVPYAGSSAIAGSTTIETPTDKFGLGGSMGILNYTQLGQDFEIGSQVRLMSNVAPKYYYRSGRKKLFTKVENYYTFNDLTTATVEDDQPIWIVF
jgi:hypothetical protein